MVKKWTNTIIIQSNYLDIMEIQKILNGFNILYKKNPKRIVKIDASESKEIISGNINYHVSELLNIND